MNKQVRRDRPLGVTIIGVLLLLAGLVAILSGVLIGSLGDLSDIELAVELVALVIGLIYIIAAFGFFKGWSWVWLVTMVILVLGIIIDIASWAIHGMDDIVGLLVDLIIPVIILLYMNSQNVKAFFRRS
ncbi:MAG: hypothetical protein A4E29_00665 [Methanomassiliicoccales archaeon PtaB.Bin134]|nr:MAG: hypothetical protein A4E29_00665 [Methanomassiliicoccales archaeon PtaB.Bin134]